ncbi:RluA family pseudouridine synthase, partial [Lacticaseibacillus paracasei]
FWQPLKHKLIDLHAPLPADMATLAAKLRLSQQD